MGYKVLFIRQSEHLRLYLDNIKIKGEIDDLSFPISDLQMLIIDNYKLTLSAQLINKLTENNVSVILCGLNHMPASIILAANGYHAQSGQIMKQIKWTSDIKRRLQKEIIKGKIFNQIEILVKNTTEYDSISLLKTYYGQVRNGDESNREGLASKIYFKALFGDNFKRFEEDVVNSALNYGYAIFRSLITTLLVSKGLLPNIGIFHKGKTNHTNFSDDLIEVFRPLVDDYVFNSFIDFIPEFTQEHRESLVKLSTEKVLFNGKWHTIHNSILMMIDSILKCIEENDESYFVSPITRM